MLPGPNRLTKSKDIERVVKTGRSFATPILSIKAAPGGDAATRVAVVAGLSAHKRATRRNRAKRLVREALRKNLGLVRPGFDIVISCRSGAIDKEYSEIADALSFALGRLGLLRA